MKLFSKIFIEFYYSSIYHTKPQKDWIFVFLRKTHKTKKLNLNFSPKKRFFFFFFGIEKKNSTRLLQMCAPTALNREKEQKGSRDFQRRIGGRSSEDTW